MKLNARVGRNFPTPCIICGGKGEVPVLLTRMLSTFHPDPVLWGTCAICAGSGHMPTYRQALERLTAPKT